MTAGMKIKADADPCGKSKTREPDPNAVVDADTPQRANHKSVPPKNRVQDTRIETNPDFRAFAALSGIFAAPKNPARAISAAGAETWAAWIDKVTSEQSDLL